MYTRCFGSFLMGNIIYFTPKLLRIFQRVWYLFCIILPFEYFYKIRAICAKSINQSYVMIKIILKGSLLFCSCNLCLHLIHLKAPIDIQGFKVCLELDIETIFVLRSSLNNFYHRVSCLGLCATQEHINLCPQGTYMHSPSLLYFSQALLLYVCDIFKKTVAWSVIGVFRTATKAELFNLRSMWSRQLSSLVCKQWAGRKPCVAVICKYANLLVLICADSDGFLNKLIFTSPVIIIVFLCMRTLWRYWSRELIKLSADTIEGDR